MMIRAGVALTADIRTGRNARGRHGCDVQHKLKVKARLLLQNQQRVPEGGEVALEVTTQQRCTHSNRSRLAERGS